MKHYLIVFIVIVSVSACKDRLTTVQYQNFEAPTYYNSPIMSSCSPNIQNICGYAETEHAKHVPKQNVPISQYSVPQTQVIDTECTCVTKHCSVPITSSSGPTFVPLCNDCAKVNQNNVNNCKCSNPNSVPTRFESDCPCISVVQDVADSVLQLSNPGSYYTGQSSFVPHVSTKSQPELVPCSLEYVGASKHGTLNNQHAYNFGFY